MINTLQDAVDIDRYLTPERVIHTPEGVIVIYLFDYSPTEYIIMDSGEVYSNVTTTWATIHDADWLIRVSEMELCYVSATMSDGSTHHFRRGEADKFMNDVIYGRKTGELKNTQDETTVVEPWFIEDYKEFWT